MNACLGLLTRKVTRVLYHVLVWKVSNWFFLLSLIGYRLFRKSIFGAADEIELKFMNRFLKICIRLFWIIHNACLINRYYPFLLLGETMRI